jgi:hypothetical protein
MLYTLFNIAKLDITYLLEQREGSKPMRDEIRE